MSKPNHRYLAMRRCCIVLVGALGAFSPALLAQTAPAAPATAKRLPTPLELTKYDKNANGVLEADEQAAFEAGEKGDLIMLTPFEVNTSQDKGYAAANTSPAAESIRRWTLVRFPSRS